MFLKKKVFPLASLEKYENVRQRSLLDSMEVFQGGRIL